MKVGITETCLLGLIITGLIAGTAPRAAAHHSFAAFNMNAEKTVTGVVGRVQWTNPHIWIWLDVPNGKGGTDTFGFEGMSPNFLERRNWTRNSLKAGDTITIVYRPLRDGSHGGMYVSGKTADGRVFTTQGGQAN